MSDGGGGYRWEWVERDPQDPRKGFEWRLLPYISPALDGTGDPKGPAPGSGMNLDGTMSFAKWMTPWSTPTRIERRFQRATLSA